MNPEQSKVKDFHKKYGVYTADKPSLPPRSVKELRLNLHKEEDQELVEAIETNNIVAIADALGDKMYVIYGTALSYGIDLESVFAEIHSSNMTKEGKLRDDGKILKGSTFRPPDLLTVLRNQE